MDFRDRWIFASVILMLLSIYSTVYTLTAYSIATNYIVEEDNKLYWRTSPGGSLALWPRKPGMLQALSKVDEGDAYIYNHLIKFPTLAIMITLAWIITSICIIKVVMLCIHNKT